MINKLKKNREKDARQIRKLTNQSPFAVVEAYRNLYTNITFAVPKKDGVATVIAVTSPNPREGKTTISSNLAITLAQMNYNVLLIDCDMRKPQVHRYFDLANPKGLSNLLSNQIDTKTAIMETDIPQLMVIPSGVIPPNPIELINSASMDKLLDNMKKVFDYIIIDTPPILSVADSLSLACKVDGTIIVSMQKVTTYDELEESLGKFEFAHAKVIGMVMTGCEGMKNRYKKYKNGYKYYRYYQYGYKK